MTDVVINAIIGSYGALLLLLIGFVVKLLYDMSGKLSDQESVLKNQSYIIKEIKGEAIPTIRIQIEKLDDRTENIEKRTDKLEQAIIKTTHEG